MAKDFLLDGPENKPNPGPVPFSYQSVFDAFKNKDTKTLRLYDDSIKDLRDVNNPDDLSKIFSNEENRKVFYSSNYKDLQKFNIFSLDDFGTKLKGGLTGSEKIGVINTSGKLKSTRTPVFGEPGFGEYLKNQKQFEYRDKDAKKAFADLAVAGLNVTHDGKQLDDYNQTREYFSNPDNFIKWQEQRFVQEGLSKKKLSAVSIFEKLQPKETPSTPVAEAQVQEAKVQDSFFGKIDEVAVGKILEEGGDINFSQNSGIYTDIDEDLFMQQVGQQALSSADGGQINQMNVVTRKEDKLNEESLDKYLKSRGMSPEEIESFKLDKIEKYRHSKFLKLDYDMNSKSAQGVDVDIFKVDSESAYNKAFGSRLSMYYAFGSKNKYQQDMDVRGFNMLSEKDKKIHQGLLELDKHRRGLSFYENASPEERAQAQQKYIEAYNNFLKINKEMGYAGFNVYDPTTRDPFPSEIVGMLSQEADKKYNKEYYAKTSLGKMKMERNALFLDVENLKNELVSNNPELIKNFDLKRKLYLQKSVELHTLNRALFTNDNPLKRLGGAGQQFVDGLKEGMTPDKNISRLDETLSFYNNMSRYGFVLEEKDIEQVYRNLEPTLAEISGEGLYTTTAILAETALYSTVGMGVLSSATRLKQFTRFKEAMTKMHGKSGRALVNFFEKAAEFGVKGGSQILTGQTTAGFLTEEAFEEGTDVIAKRFKQLYSNKFTAFFSKFLSGSVGSFVGEFFGNMADTLLENGFDIREAFREAYGDNWETQEKQLAAIGFMSLGFAGASNINILFKTKAQFDYYKQQLGGEFKDELMLSVERMIDDAISNYSAKTTSEAKPQNLEEPQLTDAVAMSDTPVEPPSSGVSEQTTERELEPISEQKAAEVKEAEKLEVETRVAERGEIFHVVEADGSINKEIEYRYNEETGKIESRGYTEFNNTFQEVNDELAKTVEAKVQDKGMLSKTKAQEIAKSQFNLNQDDRIVEMDGQVFLSRDFKTIKEDSNNKIRNVNTIASNTFKDKLKNLRNSVLTSLFPNSNTQIDPQFSSFYQTFKTNFSKRFNGGSLFFNGDGVITETSLRGLPKVADYLGSIAKSFLDTKSGLDLFTEVTNAVLTSERFKSSEMANNNMSSDYAKNVALQLLLNEDASIEEYFDSDKDAISTFNKFRVGFIRHSAKNFTGGQVKYNASFFNQNVDPNVSKRTEADLDKTELQQILTREQRRNIKTVFDMAGEGDRLDLNNDDNLRTVDAIRYANDELSAKEFLESLGENVDNKTDDEIKTLADQMRDQLADIAKFEAWTQKLKEFSKKERQVKKKIRSNLNKSFSYFSPELNSGIQKAKKLFGLSDRARNKTITNTMYEMLQTMALRSDTTPEDLVNNVIAFEKATEQMAADIVNKYNSSGDLSVLLDFYVGEAGATYSEELYGNMQAARELLNKGVDPKKVQMMYGVVLGPDGKLRQKLAPQFRFENAEAVRKIYEGSSLGNVIKLSDLIDYEDLFAIYPDLRNLKVEFKDIEYTGEFSASLDYAKARQQTLQNQTADENIFDTGQSPGTIIMSKNLSAGDFINTLKHEIQHAVQNLEGTQRGASTLTTGRLVFTKAKAETFIDDFVKDYTEQLALDENIPEETKQKELQRVEKLMGGVRGSLDILSQMGGDTRLGSRGSAFLFGSIVRSLHASRLLGETNLEEVVREKIKGYFDLGSTEKEIEESNQAIKKLTDGLNEMLGSEDGKLNIGDLSRFMEGISSMTLYENVLGEKEARAVESPYTRTYGFWKTMQDLVSGKYFKQNNARSKKNKYLSDRVESNIKTLTDNAKDFLPTLLPDAPTETQALFEYLDNFINSREAFNLRKNPEFNAFLQILSEDFDNLNESLVVYGDFLKENKIPVLGLYDKSFISDIDKALLTKILDERGDKVQFFSGSSSVPSYTTTETFDPTARRGDTILSNDIIDAQKRVEDELYDNPMPVFTVNEKSSVEIPESPGEKKIRVAETKLFKVLKNKLQKLYPEITLDFKTELTGRDWQKADDNIFNQLSNKKREEYKKSLEKKRPDLVAGGLIESVLDEIAKFGEENSENGMGNPKLEKLAMWWISAGNVILPEDGYKVVEAERIATIKKIDPFSFKDPTELINKYLAEVKEKPIDPDTVTEFKDKIDHSEFGVTIYTVDDTREGQEAVRKIIDTHFGKDANPWCLAARVGGNLDTAWNYWSNRYNAYPKQIAFKNGKLVGFSANSYADEMWWDRNDSPSSGIPVETPFSRLSNLQILNAPSDISQYVFSAKIGKDGVKSDLVEKAKKTTQQVSGLRTVEEFHLTEDWKRSTDTQRVVNISLASESTYKGNKLHGVKKTYYKNGQLETEENYKDGQPDGVRKTYLENGQLASEFNYKDGELDGVRKQYYYNGQLYLEENYKDGELDGVQKEYHENGKLFIEQNYKDGQPDGVRKTYYDNGQLETEDNYKDGQPDGVRKTYQDNGQLKFEYNYKDGQFDGVQKRYYDNGQLYLEENYKDGELDGVQKAYYKNGQLKFEQNYKDGLKHGVQKKYLENGQLQTEENYKDGQPDGVWKQYYYNGQLYLEENYKDGLKHGVQKKYLENGQLQTEENYKDDKMFGSQIVYYENGQISTKYGWNNGRDGEFVMFYKNGQPSTKAYYEEGKLNGKRTTYYLDGTISSNAFFIDGVVSGRSKVFYPDGKLMADFDHVIGETTRYDREGNEVSYQDWENSYDSDRYNHEELTSYLFHQKRDGKIVGQANLKEMTVLIDAIEQSADTLPHEYAHHYIGWFRDTPLVKEAIRRYGSEEALVQAIGEEVVNRNGEAWNWFKRFTEWVKNFFRDMDSLEKNQILDTLTNSFLTAKDLETKKTGISAERSRELARRATEGAVQETLLQADDSGVVRGAVVIEDTKATIYAMTDPTVLTPLHELAHVYEKYLTDQEREEVLAAAGKTVWDRSVSEYFARGFETFIDEGVPPSKKLEASFRKFKLWVSALFNAIDAPDVELNDDMRRIYSIMLGETPITDVPAGEISSGASDIDQIKNELEQKIYQMRRAGNTDDQIYKGLITEGLFTPADLSDYFNLNTKKTVYDNLNRKNSPFIDEASQIFEDSQQVVRDLAELTQEMSNISEDEARGILFGLNALPNIDVAVAKLIKDMLEKAQRGEKSFKDFQELVEAGTNIGRALQRFKMLKKQQAELVVASLVKELAAVGAKIPPRALDRLNKAARRLTEASENLEIAREANKDATMVNATSPFDQNQSNHEYFKNALIEHAQAKLDYAKEIQRWTLKSSNLGGGKAVADLYKTMVRLLLLTFRSLGRNLTSNLVKAALNTSVNKIATSVSILRKLLPGQEQATFKEFKYNKATRKGIGPGLKQTKEVLKYGNITDIGQKVEIQGGFNGFRALVEWTGAAFDSFRGSTDLEIAEKYNFVLDKNGKIKNADKFLRFVEGGPQGVLAEGLGRLMQAGDMVFKNTAYYGALYQEARRRGLKTEKEINHFMSLYSDYSDMNAYEDALSFVYANDSKAYKVIKRILSGGGSDFYSSLYTTLVPYQKIPTNVLLEYFEFMTPAYGIASAGYKFRDSVKLQQALKKEKNPGKKLVLREKIDRNNQNVEQSIGRAITGFGLYTIAFELVKLGVLSGTASNKEEREEKDIYGGSNRINVTMLLEKLGYLKKQERNKNEALKTDRTIELEALGVFGAILVLSQNKFENSKSKYYNKSADLDLTITDTAVEALDPTDVSSYTGPLGYAINLSFLKNIGSLVEAIVSLGDPDAKSDKGAKFLVDLAMTSTSVVLPNMLTDITKTIQGTEGVKFDYNLSEISGFKKATRDFQSRINERLFRSMTDILDPAVDKDVFNQPKKLTPPGSNPAIYQMFDLSRMSENKGVEKTYTRILKGEKPSWQDLVSIARLFNAPDKVFPGIPKKIKEAGPAAIKLNPTLEEIQNHKQAVLKIRESLVSGVIDKMYEEGNLKMLLDMSEEINKKQKNQVPMGVVILSNILGNVYSASERLVNRYSIPLIEKNEIERIKQDPKKYKKYQELMSNNIYGAFYEEIENNEEYRKDLKNLKETIMLEIKDIMNNLDKYGGEDVEQ